MFATLSWRPQRNHRESASFILADANALKSCATSRIVHFCPPATRSLLSSSPAPRHVRWWVVAQCCQVVTITVALGAVQVTSRKGDNDAASSWFPGSSGWWCTQGNASCGCRRNFQLRSASDQTFGVRIFPPLLPFLLLSSLSNWVAL